MRLLSLPMMDSSAMISAILFLIASRTFCRCRSRSPALRSLRCPEDELYGRKMVSAIRTMPLCGSRVTVMISVLPKIVGGVLENDVDATRAVAVLEQILDHNVILFRLFLVTHPRFRNNPAEISD